MTTSTEKTELKRVSFKTSPDQLKIIEELARNHHRTLSGEIRMALDAWIEQRAADRDFLLGPLLGAPRD